MKGKVKWFNRMKRFGFIEVEGKDDVFVHQSALAEGTKMLNDGDEVEFDVEETDKGLQAKNVKKTGEAGEEESEEEKPVEEEKEE